ncbi:MAG: IclR family transcriptional regulator [Synergistales bacterium]|nr:IclR family transcriptional regulator [Synergistales bacterium]
MNATEKTLWILKRLAEPPYSMTLTELAEELGLARSGLYKTLTQMAEEQFLLRHPDTKRYSLGPVLFRLGNLYKSRERLWDVAVPVMERLREETGESVALGILEGAYVVLVDIVESSQDLRVSGRAGRKYPLNLGALGKVAGAFLPEERRDALLRDFSLTASTPYSIADPGALRREYAAIRARGYALSSEESTLGSCGIAAPVFDESGRFKASLALGVPAVRFAAELREPWAERVVEAARMISRQLGFQGA